jgi:hypothetical protein
MEGVTLTIEAGVTIDAGYLQVNGTLVARGSDAEPIRFAGGTIELMPTSSDSIIERVIISSPEYSIKCNNVSPTIKNNTINGDIHVNSSSPTISNNVIAGTVSIEEGSPTIINNKLSTDWHGIECTGGSPTIANNIVEGQGASETIGIFGGGGKISNNIISGFQKGVKAGAIIEGNLIMNNYFGIDVGYYQTIRRNTIMNNNEGLYVGESESIIEFNNFQNNSHNVYLNIYATRNITAENNWWGTTDVQTIEEKIHSNWKDFDFITVDYAPFLTAPDSDAPTIQNSQPNGGTSVFFGLDWIGVAVLVLLGVIAVLLVFVVVYLRKKSMK